jgi:nitroreductase
MPSEQHQSSRYDPSSNDEDALKRKDSPLTPALDDHITTAVDSLPRQRFSCRYFLPDKVPDTHTLNSIFESARRAPSGSNFQPWKVHVMRSDPKSQVSIHVQHAFEKEADAYHSPYEFYPAAEKLEQPPYQHLIQRRKEFGRNFYGPLNIDHSDTGARRQMTARNWKFFDAPIGLIITTVDIASTGSYLDVGFFVMSLLVSARAHGLEACVQESHAIYNDVYAKELSLDAGNESVVCGVALGYVDMDRNRESWRQQTRMDLEELIVYHG